MTHKPLCIGMHLGQACGIWQSNRGRRLLGLVYTSMREMWYRPFCMASDEIISMFLAILLYLFCVLHNNYYIHIHRAGCWCWCWLLAVVYFSTRFQGSGRPLHKWPFMVTRKFVDSSVQTNKWSNRRLNLKQQKSKSDHFSIRFEQQHKIFVTLLYIYVSEIRFPASQISHRNHTIRPCFTPDLISLLSASPGNKWYHHNKNKYAFWSAVILLCQLWFRCGCIVAGLECCHSS